MPWNPSQAPQSLLGLHGGLCAGKRGLTPKNLCLPAPPPPAQGAGDLETLVRKALETSYRKSQERPELVRIWFPSQLESRCQQASLGASAVTMTVLGQEGEVCSWCQITFGILVPGKEQYFVDEEILLQLSICYRGSPNMTNRNNFDFNLQKYIKCPHLPRRGVWLTSLLFLWGICITSLREKEKKHHPVCIFHFKRKPLRE